MTAQTWWLDPGFIAFDTETTGIDAATDRIVTAAAIAFVNGEPVDVRSWLIKVDIPIPQASTAVHGITDDMCQRDGVDQAAALVELRDTLDCGLPVVAFNAAFDLGMLAGNLARIGAAPLRNEIAICPMIVDKHFNKYVRGSNQRRLAPTAERYGLDFNDDDWHGAEPDAVMAGRILLAELAAYPDMRAMSPVQLAEGVQLWRTQQEAEFQTWLASRRTL